MKSRAFILLITVAMLSLVFSSCTGPLGDGNDNPDTGISGTIVNGHWTADTYVSGGVEVSGSLVIDQGVTVTFASDAYIAIDGGASFTAVGAPGFPIQFKPSSPSVKWRQIYIDDGAGTSMAPIKMSYCTVTGAGSNSYSAIRIGANYFTAVADIEYCSVYGNAAVGIEADRAGPGTILKHDTFFSNADFAVVANDNVDFDATNEFAALGSSVDLTNPKNCVVFRGDIASANRVFDIIAVPYYLDYNVTVLTGAKLSVDPGATLQFGLNAYLSIASGGVLDAEGSSGSAISFQSKSVSVTWGQIFFDDGSIGNKMYYCSVTGAGYSGSYAIQIGQSLTNAVVDIQHCDISGNAGGGIEAQNSGSGSVISNNTFASNTALGGTFDIDLNGASVTVSNNGTATINP